MHSHFAVREGELPIPKGKGKRIIEDAKACNDELHPHAVAHEQS